MNLNIGLILVCLTGLTIGLYRQFPVTFDSKFLLQWAPLAAVSVVIGIVLFWKGGSTLFFHALNATGKVSASYFPTLVWFLPVMGFSVVLATCYKEEIKEALQGKWGILGTFFASGLAPSGQALAGFIRELWDISTLRPKLLYCLTITPLISWNIFIIRQMGLGWDISWRMYVVNFAIAIFLALPFWIWSKMVGG